MVMYAYIMLRTQISLDEAQRRLLNTVAGETGRSISALIRDAVELAYGRARSTDEDLEAMRRAFGAWKDRGLDGSHYVEAVRSGRRLRA